MKHAYVIKLLKNQSECLKSASKKSPSGYWRSKYKRQIAELESAISVLGKEGNDD